jgi:hypothetical protein
MLVATLVAIGLILAAGVGAAAAPTARGNEPCSWGASSIQAEVVDGKIAVVSGPDTTGCIPRTP